MKQLVQIPKWLKHQQARTRVRLDDSDSKSMGTAQPTPNVTTMRDKCSQPKNLTHLSTTIQQYVSPSTSIFHIKKRSNHAQNLSKDDANRNNRGLLTQ